MYQGSTLGAQIIRGYPEELLNNFGVPRTVFKTIQGVDKNSGPGASAPGLKHDVNSFKALQEANEAGAGISYPLRFAKKKKCY